MLYDFIHSLSYFVTFFNHYFGDFTSYVVIATEGGETGPPAIPLTHAHINTFTHPSHHILP